MSCGDPCAYTLKPPRLAAIDGLRLIAALAVMLFHYTAAEKLVWGNPSRVEFPGMNFVTKYGYLGVELFFIISGFVILMTAYGRTIQDFVASRSRGSSLRTGSRLSPPSSCSRSGTVTAPPPRWTCW